MSGMGCSICSGSPRRIRSFRKIGLLRIVTATFPPSDADSSVDRRRRRGRNNNSSSRNKNDNNYNNIKLPTQLAATQETKTTRDHKIQSGEAYRVNLGFIDVETSPDAIKEDEDLIEAVEAFVGGTAQSVYEDIMNDLTGIYHRASGAVAGTFPFLLHWKEDRSHFWADVEKLTIFLALFAFAFAFLAPSFGRRRKKKKGSWLSSDYEELFRDGEREKRLFGMSGDKKGSLFRRRHSSSSPAMAELAAGSERTGIPTAMSRLGKTAKQTEEESLEEQFAMRWPTLSKSKYRGLILPPECKRVEKPRNRKDEKKRRRSSIKPQEEDKEEEFDEDHPVQRITMYYKQCKHILISLIKFDFMGVFDTLTHLFQACFKTRRQLPNVDDDEIEDDESDAGSIRRTSVSSQVSNTAAPSSSTRTSLRSSLRTSTVSKPSATNANGKDHDSDAESTASNVSVNNTAKSNKRVSIAPDLHSDSMPVVTALNRQGSSKVGLSMDSVREMERVDEHAVPKEFPSDTTKIRDALQAYRAGSIREIPSTPGDGNTEAEDLIDNMPDMPDRVGFSNMNHRASMPPPDFFDSAETQEHLRRMVLEAPIPDENGYILGDEFLPDNSCTPLLVFVNSRSGQKQGQLLVAQLRSLLNPIQVWDLADGGPEEALQSFTTFSRLRVLVCGGDGTVSWVVGTIEKMNLPKWPPIAICPLGTGNDLARIHGWGGGYNNESLTGILQDVTESYVSWLDRWEIIEETKKGKVKSVKEFLNYLGVGADAQAALQVHMLRESRPQLFFSRVVNKIWYALFGAEDIIKASSLHLPHEITLIADGVEVPLPSDSQGIIFLNIDSYAGGVPLWSSATKETEEVAEPYSLGLKPVRRGVRRSRSLDEICGTSRPRTNSMDRVDSKEDISSMTDGEKFDRVTAADKPSSCQDGLLDVVSIRGAFHLGQIRVGLGHAQKLCQCRSAEVIIKRKVAVQLDGEPWRQNVSVLKVKRKKDAAIMLHKTADDSNGVESEMTRLLEWAEDENLIDSSVHAAMMKEFSRRIERNTRQKRIKPQDNLMFALKRAMAPSDEDDDSKNPSLIMF